MRLTRSHGGKFELEKVRLPLVAFIDVVLFLLLYFVISGNMAAEEQILSTTLGASQGRSQSLLQSQMLVIEIQNGLVVYRIGERVMPDREALAGVLAQLPHDAGIIVRPSPEVPVEATAAAVQEAKNAGFTRISYLVGGA